MRGAGFELTSAESLLYNTNTTAFVIYYCLITNTNIEVNTFFFCNNDSRLFLRT